MRHEIDCRRREEIEKTINVLHHCPALRKAGFDAAFFSNKMVRKLTFGIFMMLFGKIILGFVLLSVVSVVIYRWAPVRYTPLMAIRSVEQMLDGRKVRCEHKWVPLDEMSRHMPMAVIASEDNRFASHTDSISWKSRKPCARLKTEAVTAVQARLASRRLKTCFYGRRHRG